MKIILMLVALLPISSLNIRSRKIRRNGIYPKGQDSASAKAGYVKFNIPLPMAPVSRLQVQSGFGFTIRQPIKRLIC